MAPRRGFSSPGPLPVQGALSGSPTLLSPYQKDWISFSLSLGISATSVEDLAAPDYRGGMWGQIHLRGFCKRAVLCTSQYGVLPIASGRFCFVSGGAVRAINLSSSFVFDTGFVRIRLNQFFWKKLKNISFYQFFCLKILEYQFFCLKILEYQFFSVQMLEYSE